MKGYGWVDNGREGDKTVSTVLMYVTGREGGR